MLAVKKLCDLQRALLQAESGQGSLRRKAPRALQLVAIEGPDSSSSPRTPRMQTFQDSELSAELQTAMSKQPGGCEQGLAVRNAVGMWRSQESVDSRSRGSGRSQELAASSSPHGCSQESLDSRDLPEGFEQRPLKQVPLGTATVFKYPAVAAKPDLAGPSSPAAALTAHSASAHATQSLSRYALSDGEPEDDDEPPSPHGHLSSYATLTRKPGRSQLARLPSSPEQTVGRSQSFAVRARKKGPPPPPPKRLSSASSSTSGELPAGGAASGELTVRTIAASLEGRTDGQNRPSWPASRGGSGPRRRVHSECLSARSSGADTDQGLKSDSEEEEGGGLKGPSSPSNSSSECIPFAEEGNLTIKQRPKAPGPPRAQAVLEPPDTPPARSPEVPQFHLKESDTVKRRHKPKDKEPDLETGSWFFSQSQEEVRLGKTTTSLERPATASSIKAAGSSKPPTVAPKPVRHSLLAAQGKDLGPVDPRPLALLTGGLTWDIQRDCLLPSVFKRTCSRQLDSRVLLWPLGGSRHWPSLLPPLRSMGLHSRLPGRSQPLRVPV